MRGRRGGRPQDLTAALKDATEIEYALEFDGSEDGINAINPGRKRSEHLDSAAVSQTLDALTKRLESLETTLHNYNSQRT